MLLYSRLWDARSLINPWHLDTDISSLWPDDTAPSISLSISRLLQTSLFPAALAPRTRGNPEAFSGCMRYVIPPSSGGSAGGSPLNWTWSGGGGQKMRRFFRLLLSCKGAAAPLWTSSECLRLWLYTNKFSFSRNKSASLTTGQTQRPTRKQFRCPFSILKPNMTRDISIIPLMTLYWLRIDRRAASNNRNRLSIKGLNCIFIAMSTQRLQTLLQRMIDMLGAWTVKGVGAEGRTH